MKQIVSLSLLLLPLFATNGDNLTGAGVKSRASAGAAQTKEVGIESIFTNPALLNDIQKPQSGLGITLFHPTVYGNSGNGFHKSNEDFETIPYLGITSPIDSTQSVGIGLFSISGMGVDYNHYNDLANTKTKLAYGKLCIAYAKRFDRLSLGVSIDPAFGRLYLSTVQPFPQAKKYRYASGLGYHFGVKYDIDASHTLALTYTSKVDMKYSSIYDFNGDNRIDDFKLTQPKELSIAFGKRHRNLHIELNYKKIFWSQARGYQDFQWRDQSIYAIGVTYTLDPKQTLYSGISWTKSPLKQESFSNRQIAFFNLIGFPALSKRHVGIGYSKYINKEIRFNISTLYSPKEKLSFSTLQATNKQLSISLGIDYVF